MYVTCVLNELELFFLFSFSDIFILRELSDYSETHLWRVIRVVIYTWAYRILDFVHLVVFWKITLVSETLSLQFLIKNMWRDWGGVGCWYKVTLLFTEHGPTLYLTTERDRFYENLSCLPNCNIDGRHERKSGPMQNETFSNGKLLIAKL